MVRKEWDPEDYLDFDYRKKPEDSNAKRQYEALRYGAEAVPREPQQSTAEIEAIRKAQQEADERYRSVYSRNTRKKNKKKTGKWAKLLSLVYLAALAAFTLTMTVMNVLPLRMLLTLYAVLALLSLIIIIQLHKRKLRKWIRVSASVLAILLIGVYSMGTAYALGTLDFLDDTSVENKNRVGSITQEPFNVCITGIDQSGTIDTEGRSDVNMVVTVNPVTNQILMTSIPRDYEIYMPDKDNAMDKLTHTGFYSVDTTIGAEEQLLDITMNYFVKVNFSTVEKFVDAVGGIDVKSEYEFTPVKLKSWTVKEGKNHMNGKQALAFARERKAFADGDRQRIKNQQAVFEAIIKKATSSRTMVLNYNKIISNLKDYFRMSISSSEFRSLIKLQLAFDPKWKIYKNTITGGDASLPTYSAGYAYVMSQDPYSIENARTLIHAVMEGKKLTKDSEGNVTVKAEENTGTEAE